MSEYVFPDWPAPENVRAVTTTRLGGFSAGTFAGMNLGTHVGDEPRSVARNREQLKRALRLPGEPAWLDQVHGTAVRRLDGPSVSADAPHKADAAWTNTTGVVCCVLTADCLPVMLCDPGGSCVGVAHAGWRGLVGGVIETAVAAMAAPELLAWLGPAISQAAYEVGPEVREACLARYPHAAEAFIEGHGDRWYADLYAIARAALAGAGVVGIYGGDFCTHADARRFFSHRRESPCGRMASLIWLNPG